MVHHAANRPLTVANARNDFAKVLNEALDDLALYGYDSADRVAMWVLRLRQAAEKVLTPDPVLDKMMRQFLDALYRRNVDKGAILSYHPGIGRFTIEKLRPELLGELERRKAASIALIKLNREQEMSAMERRFAGWATSIPKGGTADPKKAEQRETVRKSISGLPFRERRVLIDQGQKMISAINGTIAKGGGALAAFWNDHYHQANYDYREEHKAFDIASRKLPFVIRGNWAMAKGLMKLNGSIYTDQIEQPGEKVFCRCQYTYVYDLQKLIPFGMITALGLKELDRVNRELA